MSELIKGDNVVIQFYVDGQKYAEGYVEKFSDASDVDVLQFRSLGNRNTFKDVVLNGHSGTITVGDTDPNLHRAIDLYFEKLQQAIPATCTIITTRNYKNSGALTYAYTDCTLSYESSSVRDDYDRLVIQWSTGQPRLEQI